MVFTEGTILTHRSHIGLPREEIVELVKGHEGPLKESFYRGHNLGGLKIADPFMGGGTPLFEANRLGCDVIGHDINPMSYWIVKQEIEHLDLDAYRAANERLVKHLESEIGGFYRTRCLKCGSGEALVKYFLWVKTMACRNC